MEMIITSSFGSGDTNANPWVSGVGRNSIFYDVGRENFSQTIQIVFLDFLMYTANVLSVESTDECLRTKSENNKQ